MKEIVPKFFAEFCGVAIIVFFGCMCCTEHPNQPSGLIYHAFTFSMAIMFAIHIFDCISGAHFNPAITIAAILYKKIDFVNATVYIAGQFLGGFFGYGFLLLLVPESYTSGSFCLTKLNSELSSIQGVFIELFATACLTMIVCAIWDYRNASGAATIPLKVGLAILSLALASVSIFE